MSFERLSGAASGETSDSSFREMNPRILMRIITNPGELNTN
jgi:hypothetical protein